MSPGLSLDPAWGPEGASSGQTTCCLPLVGGRASPALEINDASLEGTWHGGVPLADGLLSGEGGQSQAQRSSREGAFAGLVVRGTMNPSHRNCQAHLVLFAGLVSGLQKDEPVWPIFHHLFGAQGNAGPWALSSVVGSCKTPHAYDVPLVLMSLAFCFLLPTFQSHTLVATCIVFWVYICTSKGVSREEGICTVLSRLEFQCVIMRQRAC